MLGLGSCAGAASAPCGGGRGGATRPLNRPTAAAPCPHAGAVERRYRHVAAHVQSRHHGPQPEEEESEPPAAERREQQQQQPWHGGLEALWRARRQPQPPRPLRRPAHPQAELGQQQQQQRRRRRQQRADGAVGPDELDWRSFRAKLVAQERAGLLEHGRGGGSAGAAAAAAAFSPGSWAHELAAPEPGCLLVARQGGLDFFDRSVVLLAAHGADNGSFGFALNKPSPLTMSQMQLPATAQSMVEAFGHQRLQLGGPVHVETLTLLHGFAGVAGAQRVSEGVYYGGLPAAVELVRAGLASREEFQLMLGLSGWAPGQLEREVAMGAWYVVAAGRDLVLPPRGGQHLRPGPDAAWRRMLELIGRS